MGKPTVTKGSLTFYGNPRARQEFMYNPTEIHDSKSTNWGRTQVPHISHPVYQYGSGGPRQISFDLHHDGDRARALGNQLRTPNDPGLDIAPWLKFWRSLLYPSRLESDAVTANATAADEFNFSLWTSKAPNKVIFNYGTFWDDVLCVVINVDIAATMFTPSGEIMRATASLILEEAPEFPLFANDVFTNDVVSTGLV